MRKPRKPTKPFGYAVFGKNGSVSKKTFQLSNEKEQQEIDALNYFIKGMKRINLNFELISSRKLEEADQDFLLETSDGKITIQLTEIVEIDYAKPLTIEKYRKGHHDGYILKKSGSIPWAVDNSLRDSSIKRRIEKKLNEHYSKPSSSKFWLVIFSTSSTLLMEYHEGGILKKGKPLVEAQEYLNSLPSCVFDEIWFTDLIINPVKIWPPK